MKKKLLIALGILLILGVAGAWTYLLVYGKPANTSEIFTRFGFGEENTPPPMPEGETVVDVGVGVGEAPKPLRQLTTRPVAGASVTETGVYYVEQGTGHVYHIDLSTGEEKLLSGTTIRNAREAVFSPDASYVAITATVSGVSETTVGFINGLAGTITGVALPPDASEVAFSKDATSTVLYLLPTDSGSSGFAYTMEDAKVERLFTIPLRDVRVLWGEPTYVYTSPTNSQTGYVYEVAGDSLEYVAEGGTGLSALRTEGGVAVTKIADGIVHSFLEGEELDIPLLVDKCASVSSGYVYCGLPAELSAPAYPDSWYMGTHSFNDILVRFSVSTEEIYLMSDFFKETGREMDILRIGADEGGEKLWFVNKNDNALWFFDTTISSAL